MSIATRRRPPHAASKVGRRTLILGVLAATLGWLGIAASPAAAIPAGMHYELVSPADAGGTWATPDGQSADGSRVRLLVSSGQGFAGTPSMFELSNLFVSSRTSTGWVTSPLNPPAAPDLRAAVGLDYNPGLDLALVRASTMAQYHLGQEQFLLSGIGLPLRQASPVLTDLTGASRDETQGIVYAYGGASEDLSHVIFSTVYDRRLLATDSGAAALSDLRLYEIANAGTPAAVLRRVDVDEAGGELGRECGARFGGYVSDPFGNSSSPSQARAISADGSKIFFSARPGADTVGGPCDRFSLPLKLFARIDGQHTVELSASECVGGGCSGSSGDVAYQTASKDGRRVAFLSGDRLTNTDADSTQDLYIYDFGAPAGHRLTQASAGDVTPGANADVEGVVRMSDDGTRTYFVARGVLTAEENSFGQTATAGADNLYLYEAGTGKTSFVAQLSGLDSGLWGAVEKQRVADVSDAAGRFLLFSSYAPIATGDTDTLSGVYRFDAEHRHLVQVSRGDGGGASVPSAEIGAGAAPLPRRISADGSRVVFWTDAALVPGDDNGAGDAYLWDQGQISLVSDGKDRNGVRPETLSITPSGGQVAFATSRRLVAEDVDDVESAYVAREGDDIVRNVVPSDSCTGDACQGSPGSRPSSREPNSPPDGGLGNVRTVEPAFRVPKLSAVALSKLARTGAVTLPVTVSEGGAIVATARGLVGRRDTTLGTAKASANAAGVMPLVLRLTKAARKQLASTGRLTGALHVTFSKVAVVQTQTLKLKKAKAKKKTKKNTKTKSRKTKRASAHAVKRAGR